MEALGLTQIDSHATPVPPLEIADLNLRRLEAGERARRKYWIGFEYCFHVTKSPVVPLTPPPQAAANEFGSVQSNRQA
jgi:hypothetical protein